MHFQPQIDARTRTILGIWNHNCSPRRKALIDLLLSLTKSGVKVESYGRCQHRTPQGLEFWTAPNRRLPGNWNLRKELAWNQTRCLTEWPDCYPLYVCRQSRIMFAEENDLCPGYTPHSQSAACMPMPDLRSTPHAWLCVTHDDLPHACVHAYTHKQVHLLRPHERHRSVRRDPNYL